VWVDALNIECEGTNVGGGQCFFSQFVVSNFLCFFFKILANLVKFTIEIENVHNFKNVLLQVVKIPKKLYLDPLKFNISFKTWGIVVRILS
jgi:hypothetical protein